MQKVIKPVPEELLLKAKELGKQSYDVYVFLISISNSFGTCITNLYTLHKVLHFSNQELKFSLEKLSNQRLIAILKLQSQMHIYDTKPYMDVSNVITNQKYYQYVMKHKTNKVNYNSQTNKLEIAKKIIINSKCTEFFGKKVIKLNTKHIDVQQYIANKNRIIRYQKNKIKSLENQLNHFDLNDQSTSQQYKQRNYYKTQAMTQSDALHKIWLESQ